MMALMPPHSACDDDTLDMSMESMLDDSIGAGFSANYGTRPDIPANICEKEYAGPLALFHCCTEEEPCRRPSAQHLALAAEDYLHGKGFPDVASS